MIPFATHGARDYGARPQPLGATNVLPPFNFRECNFLGLCCDLPRLGLPTDTTISSVYSNVGRKIWADPTLWCPENWFLECGTFVFRAPSDRSRDKEQISLSCGALRVSIGWAPCLPLRGSEWRCGRSPRPPIFEVERIGYGYPQAFFWERLLTLAPSLCLPAPPVTGISMRLSGAFLTCLNGPAQGQRRGGFSLARFRSFAAWLGVGRTPNPSMPFLPCHLGQPSCCFLGYEPSGAPTSAIFWRFFPGSPDKKIGQLRLFSDHSTSDSVV